MAKYAYVATKWVGTGTDEDPQRPDIPEGYTRCEDVTGQFVHLAKGSPDPNVVVVKIEESREKHTGYIDSLKPKLKQVVIDEWQTDIEGQVISAALVASSTKLGNYLTNVGISATVKDEILAEQSPIARGRKLAKYARTFEKKVVEPIPL